ncbi:4-coumarate--CoA ligase-like 9 [Ricinus communis]|uniref:AMP dependent CoA ligase, putative n=1 Tax=Ricinus communis TaxID=3988 RepID=B9RAJ6_RICCO|nr:4-coumarate--CoA ligase-like 9 [Ricinus communis]EEF51823.1 AMP dependent CoA ligase, putative [Ricinus communis]|eukprot:XP_002511221.1 4-coumarate--CoA ligase-like 9 [Ricinus communis]
MATVTSNIDPNNGFCKETKTFHSLRPSTPLPPSDQPLSIAQYAVSLLNSTTANLTATTFLIDSNTAESLTFSQFLNRTRSLSFSLKTHFSLSPNDVAFILCPASLHVPLLYFSLLSLGLTISPANPLSSNSEVAHQTQLSQPKIAFATSQTAHKIPSPPSGTILIDSPEFLSFLHNSNTATYVSVNQSDPAAILYSSGTTGKVKGVSLTHRNIIALISGFYHNKGQTDPNEPEPEPVSLFTLPLFHVFGFFMLVRAFAMGETVVLMERFDFEGMLRAVEKYKVAFMPVSPPLIVALVKSDLTKKYDLSSLLFLGCGGAPLGKDVSDRFKDKFPQVEISQGYGLTETGGGAARMISPEEFKQHGSVGRLAENMEAKIVDPVNGEALPPGQRGELWLRGPTLMKGYVKNEKATAETLDSEGWLKTGDICYFDSQGFLYIVDRLKELIKYKAYQVPPAELEQLLHSHLEIADAAVVPYADEEAGQIPMAYIVRKPGSDITEAEVMDFIAKQVAPYKKIRRVAFINAIPKSPAGKILRRELVDLAISDHSSKL